MQPINPHKPLDSENPIKRLNNPIAPKKLLAKFFEGF
jgi:hypothetical protein